MPDLKWQISPQSNYVSCGYCCFNVMNANDSTRFGLHTLPATDPRRVRGRGESAARGQRVLRDERLRVWPALPPQNLGCRLWRGGRQPEDGEQVRLKVA